MESGVLYWSIQTAKSGSQGKGFIMIGKPILQLSKQPSIVTAEEAEGQKFSMAVQKLGQYKVSWEAVDHAITKDGKKMFWTAREKHLKGIPLIGHSKAFRSEIDSELATLFAKIKVGKAQYMNEEKVRNAYLHQLKNIEDSKLFKIVGDEYVIDIDSALRTLNECSIEAAMLSLKERYSDKIRKNLPENVKDREEFIKDFLTTGVFAENRPVPSHEDIERALLKYMRNRSDKSQKFGLSEADADQIRRGLNRENDEIAQITKIYKDPGVKKIIELWQIKTEYKKDVKKNEGEIKRLIVQTLDAKEAERRNNEIINQIQDILKEIPRGKEETVEQYIKRASSEVKGAIHYSMFGVANEILKKLSEELSLEQQELDVWKTANERVRENNTFKEFTQGEKALFDKRFNSEVGKLPRKDQRDLSTVSTIGRNLIKTIYEEGGPEAQKERLLQHFLRSFESQLSSKTEKPYYEQKYKEQLVKIFRSVLGTIDGNDKLMKAYLNLGPDDHRSRAGYYISIGEVFKNKLKTYGEFTKIENSIVPDAARDRAAKQVLIKLRKYVGLFPSF